MKDELLKILGITPDAKATDADIESSILSAVKTLAANAANAQATLDEESVINKMIAESHGALTTASARQVLKNRKSYAEANAKPTAAKPSKPAKK